MSDNTNIYNKKIQKIDFFYQSSYTSTTASGIKKLYDTIHIACKSCKVKEVDMKMEVLDNKLPIFVLYRKKYCVDCCLKLLYSK